MRARKTALTTLILGLLVTNLDLVLADVIGDLGFPPAQAGPDAGPPADPSDLSQDEIDYLLQSIGPGEEMAAAIQASPHFKFRPFGLSVWLFLRLMRKIVSFVNR